MVEWKYNKILTYSESRREEKSLTEHHGGNCASFKHIFSSTTPSFVVYTMNRFLAEHYIIKKVLKKSGGDDNKN
ncbi:MAG: hypothetical protein FWC02_00965 [Firmicutes bacterium]|nr:hypothetical protein [Bacillota bacterium]